jgi:hypothetical protein
MPVEERGASKAAAKACPCEACKKARKEPSKIAPMTVHSYTSQPSGGWVKQMTPAQERGAVPAPVLFMGVELETTVPRQPDRGTLIAEEIERRLPYPRNLPYEERYNLDGSETTEFSQWRADRNRIGNERYGLEMILYGDPDFGREPGRCTGEEAVSLAQPFGFWHAKHDGSVTGPEFASLPASLEYWYAIRDDLDAMFTGLLHGGLRSHNGDTAGMHISMSVEAFVDSDHITRFAKLVNHNVTWARKMSQRTEHSMSWCRVGEDFFGKDTTKAWALDDWAKNIMRYGQTDAADRYSAINAQCGGGRIEFRLPRGTLRLDRFYKNLEWVAAMVEFTREYADTKSVTFMRWVMGQFRFPALKAYITEKFGLPESSQFLPEPATTSLYNVTNKAAERDGDEDPSLCPCGDGCYRDECGSCADDFGDEDEDEDEDPFPSQHCGTCGLLHDMPDEMYQPRPRTSIERHTLPDGWEIGPRRFWNATTGEEYQYDEQGHPIDVNYPAWITNALYTPDNIRPFVNDERYPWLNPTITFVTNSI